MKPHNFSATTIFCLLSCAILSSCGPAPRRARTRLQDDTAERAAQVTRNQPVIEEVASFYEVREQAWLCKRREDIRVTNRPITDKNRDHFDYRIAKGKLIDLPPGTRLRRRSGVITYPQAENRKYVRVEVVGGDYNEERGLVALDSVVKIR